MRPNDKPLALSLLFAVVACGEPLATITVELDVPAVEALDPFRYSDRMVSVRVLVDGPDRFDDAASDLALTDRTASFESFPAERAVKVVVEGLDRLGNQVGYGDVENFQVDDDVSVKIPFRRPLAYVVHRPICGGACADGEACVNVLDGYECRPEIVDTECVDEMGGALACEAGTACVEYRGGPACRPKLSRGSPGTSLVYVVDLLTRALVDRVTIPGTAPRALSISARGGDGVMVTYTDGGKGYAGLLKSSDHQWETLELPAIQDLALLGAGQDIGMAMGGGQITVFDWAKKSVVRKDGVGGRVLDGKLGHGGRRALFVLNKEPGAILVQPDVPSNQNVSIAVLGAAGVAVNGEGRLGYITSSLEQSVTGVDIERSGTAQKLGGGLAAPCGAAAYSSAIEAIVCIEAGSNPRPRIHSYSIATYAGSKLENAVGALPEPSGIASGPGGARLVVVSAGTTTTSAGLTMIDTDLEKGLDGSTVSYPRDPDDTFLLGSSTIHQRYHANRVAVLYGR
ncbi:MAG: hypothetical protein HYV07_00935 [Deltaproteobacteria bacterium]|nr:hypothetical protein [Deltaproteobacteria bacterium]